MKNFEKTFKHQKNKHDPEINKNKRSQHFVKTSLQMWDKQNTTKQLLRQHVCTSVTITATTFNPI